LVKEHQRRGWSAGGQVEKEFKEVEEGKQEQELNGVEWGQGKKKPVFSPKGA